MPLLTLSLLLIATQVSDSTLQMRVAARIAKVPARRAPDIGEHNDEVLRQLGFDAAEIDGLRASGAIPKAKERTA